MKNQDQSEASTSTKSKFIRKKPVVGNPFLRKASPSVSLSQQKKSVERLALALSTRKSSALQSAEKKARPQTSGSSKPKMSTVMRQVYLSPMTKPDRPQQTLAVPPRKASYATELNKQVVEPKNFHAHVQRQLNHRQRSTSGSRSVQRAASPVKGSSVLIPKSQEYLVNAFESEFFPIA